MSDSGDLAQDRQREIDAEYEFYHGERTDLEIVQEAQKVIEEMVAYWQNVAKSVIVRHAQIQLNSWLAHKAEFEEHYNNFVEENYYLSASVEGWVCQGCYERNESDTPCHKLVTKAKAIKGVE